MYELDILNSEARAEKIVDSFLIKEKKMSDHMPFSVVEEIIEEAFGVGVDNIKYSHGIYSVILSDGTGRTLSQHELESLVNMMEE